MTIDIIVPVYDQPELTVQCFKSIKKHSKNYRLIWVDNGSSLESRKLISNEINNHENYKKIWLDRNYGFIHAVNTGIKQCNNKYLVLLNNDTVVIKNWLDRLRMPFIKDCNVMASGPLTDTVGSWQGWKNVQKTSLLKKQIPNLNKMTDDEISNNLYKTFKDQFISVKMVAFFCTMFKREIFDKIGLLDKRFALGLGDDDAICWKIKHQENKKVVLVPSTFCHHYHRSTFKKLFNKDNLEKMQKNNINLFVNLRDNNEL